VQRVGADHDGQRRRFAVLRADRKQRVNYVIVYTRNRKRGDELLSGSMTKSLYQQYRLG